MDGRRDRDGLTEEEFLKQYCPGDYVRPSVAVDMTIFTVLEKAEENYRKLPERELGVLLIQRGVHPYLGDWALPGGFVRPSETTEEAARRELEEETGLSHMYLEQLYTFSDPGRDPRTWVMSCSYMALADRQKVKLQAGDDADHAAWFSVSYRLQKEDIKPCADGLGMEKTAYYELMLVHEEVRLSAVMKKRMTKTDEGTITSYEIRENRGLAFDHAGILAYGLERLRGKTEYTDLALHLMPEEFTLTQLQQVYEAILGKSLLKAAFRRKVAALVEETELFTEKEGHRPSRLFRRKREIWE